MDNILVMGAGQQGAATCAYLISNGIKTFLWNRSVDRLNKLVDGKIKSKGIIEGQFLLTGISNNISAVLQQVIIVATDSSGHRRIAYELAPYVDENTVIILNPGRCLGAMDFIQELINSGCKAIPVIIELSTAIFTCRYTNDIIHIFAKKKMVIGAVCGNKNNSVINKIPSKLINIMDFKTNYYECTLSNVGMVLHCAPSLLNAGWLDDNDKTFLFYREGISVKIANVIKKVDEERLSISEMLNVISIPIEDWLKKTYGIEGDSLYVLIHQVEAYKTIEAPKGIINRYITEDVPNGLVPLESLGRRVGVKTPYISMFIDLANVLCDTDFRINGRNIFLYKDCYRWING